MSTTAIDWDRWRAAYAEMTFAEQQDFYDHVFEVARNQGQYSVRHLNDVLQNIALPVDVIELGGWDGGFAAELLPANPRVSRWTNYEISRKAAEASVCDDERYEAVALEDWYWSESHSCDVFVASHVLEHLSFADVKRVFDATKARFLYLQAPLSSGERDWSGYCGSHILEVGWGDVIAELRERGYRVVRPHNQVVVAVAG